jgi:hypothetical protein
MRFDLTIPDPSTMRVGKEAYVPLDKGTELHRIHPSVYKAEQFNPTAAGDARFSPIHDVSGAIIPTIYAAQTFECASCEIILRCPDTLPIDPKTGLPTFQIVFPADFKAYGHSIVRTTAALNLVDLSLTSPMPGSGRSASTRMPSWPGREARIQRREPGRSASMRPVQKRRASITARPNLAPTLQSCYSAIVCQPAFLTRYRAGPWRRLPAMRIFVP